MDERQRQRQVSMGAGLEESRLNKEFIDFLGKWGPRVLTVLLIVVAAYQGKRWLDNRADEAENAAYAKLAEAIGASNPAALLTVADEHRDRRGIFVVANLEAGKALLTEGTRGVINNAVDRLAPTAEELIDEAGRTQRFEQAKAAFSAVRDAGGSGVAAEMQRLQALSGLASAHASLGELDAARASLEEIVTLATERNYPDLAAFAAQRLAEWDRLGDVPLVLANNDLPEGARLAPTQPAGLGGLGGLQLPGGANATRLTPEQVRELGLGSGSTQTQPVTPAVTPDQSESNVPIETIDPEPAPEAPAGNDEPAVDPGETPEG